MTVTTINIGIKGKAGRNKGLKLCYHTFFPGKSMFKKYRFVKWCKIKHDWNKLKKETTQNSKHVWLRTY